MSSDIRATRVVQLTVQEQGMFKYHASSCYRNFQREMARFDIVTSHPLEQAEPSQQEPYLRDTARDLSPVYLQMSASFAVQIASQLDRRLYTHCTESLKNQWPKSYSMQVDCSETVCTQKLPQCVM